MPVTAKRPDARAWSGGSGLLPPRQPARGGSMTTARLTLRKAPGQVIGLRPGNDVEKTGTTVVEVVPGSPADAAGFKPGMVIRSVAGRTVAAQKAVYDAFSNVPSDGRAFSVVVAVTGRGAPTSPPAPKRKNAQPQRRGSGSLKRDGDNAPLPRSSSVSAKEREEAQLRRELSANVVRSRARTNEFAKRRASVGDLAASSASIGSTTSRGRKNSSFFRSFTSRPPALENDGREGADVPPPPLGGGLRTPRARPSSRASSEGPSSPDLHNTQSKALHEELLRQKDVDRAAALACGYRVGVRVRLTSDAGGRTKGTTAFVTGGREDADGTILVRVRWFDGCGTAELEPDCFVVDKLSHPDTAGVSWSRRPLRRSASVPVVRATSADRCSDIGSNGGLLRTPRSRSHRSFSRASSVRSNSSSRGVLALMNTAWKPPAKAGSDSVRKTAEERRDDALKRKAEKSARLIELTDCSMSKEEVRDMRWKKYCGHSQRYDTAPLPSFGEARSANSKTAERIASQEREAAEVRAGKELSPSPKPQEEPPSQAAAAPSQNDNWQPDLPATEDSSDTLRVVDDDSGSSERWRQEPCPMESAGTHRRCPPRRPPNTEPDLTHYTCSEPTLESTVIGFGMSQESSAATRPCAMPRVVAPTAEQIHDSIAGVLRELPHLVPDTPDDESVPTLGSCADSAPAASKFVAPEAPPILVDDGDSSTDASASGQRGGAEEEESDSSDDYTDHVGSDDDAEGAQAPDEKSSSSTDYDPPCIRRPAAQSGSGDRLLSLMQKMFPDQQPMAPSVFDRDASKQRQERMDMLMKEESSSDDEEAVAKAKLLKYSVDDRAAAMKKAGGKDGWASLSWAKRLSLVAAAPPARPAEPKPPLGIRTAAPISVFGSAENEDLFGALAASAPAPAKVAVGVRVTAHDLLGSPQLNGQQGLVVCEKGERWGVKFDDPAHGEKALRPANLTPVNTGRA